MREWISVNEKFPNVPINKVEYFNVKYEDGTEDFKPFRNRPSKNIYGFMSEKDVIAWKK